MKREYEYSYKLVKSYVNIRKERRQLTTHGYTLLKYINKGVIEDFSDKYLAVSTNIALRSLQRAKQELVLKGLLDVIKLNASTYCVLLGEEAVCTHYKVYEDKETKKIYKKALASIGLGVPEVDEPVEDDAEILDYLSTKDRLKYQKILRENPMPDEDEI